MNPENFYPLFLQSQNVVIDHRKVQKNDVFFAFSGNNFNGAIFAEDAVNAGASAVIVEHEKFENIDRNIFSVQSTLRFLQELAVLHRNLLTIPVIGLTGSNGKTTTKELIHAVLSEKYNVQYTKGNLNNHIGVPLTLLSVKLEHEIAVIEMGANHQKEIELLCTLAKPDYGYITNFGKAHLEGFGGLEGVIKGKSELYDYLISTGKTILVNQNDDIQERKTESYSRRITFGKPDSDYVYTIFSEHQFVGMKFENTSVLTKLTGEYNFTNLCAAASLGLYFGVDSDKIKTALEDYTPTNMRSQVIKKESKTLVLDTYNANPSSMEVSLKNFENFTGTKTVIIGDMLELGIESAAEHRNILELAANLGFEQIITVGKNFKEINKLYPAFENTSELKIYIETQKINSENILLKASRGISLEKIIDFI